MANDSILNFTRREKKYLLDETQYGIVKSVLQRYMDADKYAKYTVCNVYFDDAFDSVVRTSVQKPEFKEKLRLRSYGIPENGSRVFFEIKKKYNGIVYKRRIETEYSTVREYLDTGKIPEKFHDNATFKEIAYYLEQNKLYGKVYLAYDREAFHGKDDSSFRLTLDGNVRSRYDEVWFENGDFGDRLLPEGFRLMEIKLSEAMPRWLADLLNELQIYPCSFSKYGKIYMNRVRDEIAAYGNTVEYTKNYVPTLAPSRLSA